MNKGLYSRRDSLVQCILDASLIHIIGGLPVARREWPMNLQGSINENQNVLSGLYLKLKKRFTENALVLDLWDSMESDIGQQIRSLKALPPSFWRQLKQAADAPKPSSPGKNKDHTLEKEEVISLQRSFEIALEAEEPVILQIYVPIIRNLRKNWTSESLDFYILVKAHLARIVRVTESFAGDPLLAQRANILLQAFEKEVQEREEELPPPVNRVFAGPSARKQKPAAKIPKKAAKAAASPKSPAKSHRKPSKAPAKKVEVPRRRARR